MTLFRALAPVPALAAIVVIAVTCALGNWQLRRAHEKIARADRLAELAAQAPVIVTAATPAGSVLDRRVLARGRFDPAHTVLLDNRPHGNGSDSRAGFLVLSPLLLDREGDAAGADAPVNVLVLRGWLPRDAQDRTRIAPFATPEGEVAIEGTALAFVPRVYSLGDAAAESGQRIRQNLDLAAFSREIGQPMLPFVLEQRAGAGAIAQDGLARDWPADDTGADRNYGYAFQWFGLAALTAVLLVALTWRRVRRLGAKPPDGPPGDGGEAARAEAGMTTKMSTKTKN